MNLAYHYPIIYWNTACLSVNASAINAQDFYNLVDDDAIIIDETEGKRVQNKMDYAKIADALDKFKRTCVIELPDINESRLSFTPDIKHNSILYGLKGITRITEPVIVEIMNNRPFKSLDDFLNRVTRRIVTVDKIINLIKCGAFDKLEHKSRREILNDFIWSQCGTKNKLTLQNANMLIDLNLLPDELNYASDVYKITKELRKNRDANKIWYCGDRLEVPVDKIDEWRQILKDSNIPAKELEIDGEPRRVIDSARWDNFYEGQMNKIRNYIKNNHDELLKKLNQTLFDNEFKKYCSGDELQWELDSINFYFSGHPLSKAVTQMPLEINRLDSIIEGAQDGMFVIKGKEIPRMKLYTVAGTVIDRDTTKAIVTLQTVDGVISLKIYKSLFAAYNKTSVIEDEHGNELIEEESFFEKGTHLVVTGIQRGVTFIPKTYKNTGHHSIMKIVLDKYNNFVRFESKDEVK